MYTLFGFKASGSASVECALEMTGAPYRIVDAASWEKNDALAELERVNPLKQIPTLQLPDGVILTESAAILMHLGVAFPASGLLPDAQIERDLVLRGLVYIAANCYPCITILDYPERFTTATDDASLAAVRNGTNARLHHHWDIFADLYRTADGRFIGGEQPGALVGPLVGFNVGVEIGQLCIVAVVLPLAWSLRRTRTYRGAFAAGSLAIAGVAGLWFVQRAFDLSLIAG